MFNKIKAAKDKFEINHPEEAWYGKDPVESQPNDLD